MIIVTGAAGFIGSNFLYTLKKGGFKDLVAVDLPGLGEESEYLSTGLKKIDAFELPEFIRKNHKLIQFMVHLGACSDTTNPDIEVYRKLNLDYSKTMWNLCVEFGLPLIYASSASTYGDGTFGYSDDHNVVKNFVPLNHYAWSKQEFDKWALEQRRKPFFWVGLKFFNVYGPNETHKDNMASVVLKSFEKIGKTNSACLFRSHNPNYKDGEQIRDFVYVKDVCKVMTFFMEKRPQSGIFNVGTGKGRSFYDLASCTFKAMGKKSNISFVDTPENIREKYQYFTQADTTKLVAAGYAEPFYSLEEGISDYVQNYLLAGKAHIV